MKSSSVLATWSPIKKKKKKKKKKKLPSFAGFVFVMNGLTDRLI